VVRAERLAVQSGMALLRGDNTPGWFVTTPDRFGEPQYVDFPVFA